MTAATLKKQFAKLIRANPPLPALETLFEKAVAAGVLDYAGEAADSYHTAKIIYHAILSTLADEWTPKLAKDKKASRNLQQFL